ncbi:aspartate-semialdehyde dehydrogenase [Metabacillus sp. GX 13764]|uniref:aspartate-semialdehyde dehydrogenase n=1 Tax=Metabacillus kandeliae TaxID=2900151 RepID=UPI001E3F9A38|nr:aspartate-semialdehyde dehydrogenase [Metabacillus kandeliae]MCD7033728.1 aspartate-semialdehyde dehydrogenase [Metabacillus kandeliae]
METNGYRIAVVGASGAVGQQMLKTLEERDFPISEIKLLSSKRSAGTKTVFKGKELVLEEALPESFEGVQIALFSAGGSVSKELAPEAVKRGAVVIDNTSAFRMDPDVPLVVPEVNEEDIKKHSGIIANPNCSTIQMVAALEPIRAAYGLKKVVVSTYQAVSGAGTKAVDELKEQAQAILKDEEYTPELLPVKALEKHYQIAFNVIPQIDKFEENGYTFEEMKMINETKKIMHMPELKVAATCVRLPVVTGHSESLYIEIEEEGRDAKDIRKLMENAPGITLQDDPENQVYPMPAFSEGKNDVFVGRIRNDLDQSNGFHLWVVSDNLLKGAAWNSVQIAESLIKLKLI